MLRIDSTLEGELSFDFLLPEAVDLLLRDRSYLVLQLPSAVFVVETIPLAVVLDLLRVGLALCDDTLDGFICLELFLLSFLVQQEGLVVLTREIGSIQPL